MDAEKDPLWLLEQEAHALATRLARVKPFALQQTSVPAAAISPAAQVRIDRHLVNSRKALHQSIQTFLQWLNTSPPPARAQRRYSFLRLRFNAILSQVDIFADVLTQRSEHETGVWLSGLDVLAADALALPGYYQAPPVICYLDRGAGAAIRRARTRLPGGGLNPVAVIRVPRERMVGSGIASSLVHEVGHQAAALLDLVKSMRTELQRMARSHGQRSVWIYWERWISEILADFWSVARIGVGSTLGLMGVLSLPRAFVFRMNADDPHPIPWLRVKLSCAIGQVLYPHPQWHGLARIWESYYPTIGLPAAQRILLEQLEAGMADFIELLIDHRSRALLGRSLIEALQVDKRQPDRLSALYRRWRASPAQTDDERPTLVIAAIGQAKADGLISPKEEGDIVAKLLIQWALRGTMDRTAGCETMLRKHAAELTI